MTAPDFIALAKAFGLPVAIGVAAFIAAMKADLFKREHPDRNDVLAAIERSSQDAKAESRAIRERQERMQTEVTDRLARVEERLSSQERQLNRIDNRRNN